MTKTITIVFGTRPEAIKLAPLARRLKESSGFDCRFCSTGQHRQMLNQALSVFGVAPDCALDVMRPDQSLAALTARLVEALDAHLADQPCELVIVQGDTTTALCAALAAFYRHIPVAHVEAGLRSGDRTAPFPEEFNRSAIARIADWHFAPTDRAADALVAEGIAADRVFMTGNTGIDALLEAAPKARTEVRDIPDLSEAVWRGDGPLALITGHRRENFGAPFLAICRAIRRLAERFPQTAFVYPVHLNPQARRPVFDLLGDVPNIHLLAPLGYLEFVALMDRARVILTDSGGVQEEAPALGKPVVVMREKTERPEGVEAGVAVLAGADTDRIVDAVSALLTDPAHYDAMSRAVHPYGDGHACERIVDILRQGL